jgi:hypothetical protein
LAISKYYQKKGLWLLFSATAFLIHVWAILLIFQDLSWLAERTNMWDAIGVGAYGLVLALVESVFLFLIVSVPASLIQALANTAHPLRILYLIALVIVGFSVLLPVFAQLKSDKFSQMTCEFFDRLAMLVVLYLVLDFVSILVIIIRNI